MMIKTIKKNFKEVDPTEKRKVYSKDYNKNLNFFDVNKSRFSNISYVKVEICGQNDGEFSHVMVSFQPPSRFPLGNYATPIELFQPHEEFAASLRQALFVYGAYSKKLLKTQLEAPQAKIASGELP